jgi:hypothetical protein
MHVEIEQEFHLMVNLSLRSNTLRSVITSDTATPHQKLESPDMDFPSTKVPFTTSELPAESSHDIVRDSYPTIHAQSSIPHMGVLRDLPLFGMLPHNLKYWM